MGGTGTEGRVDGQGRVYESWRATGCLGLREGQDPSQLRFEADLVVLEQIYGWCRTPLHGSSRLTGEALIHAPSTSSTESVTAGHPTDLDRPKRHCAGNPTSTTTTVTAVFCSHNNSLVAEMPSFHRHDVQMSQTKKQDRSTYNNRTHLPRLAFLILCTRVNYPFVRHAAYASRAHMSLARQPAIRPLCPRSRPRKSFSWEDPESVTRGSLRSSLSNKLIPMQTPQARFIIVRPVPAYFLSRTALKSLSLLVDAMPNIDSRRADLGRRRVHLTSRHPRGWKGRRVLEPISDLAFPSSPPRISHGRLVDCAHAQ